MEQVGATRFAGLITRSSRVQIPPPATSQSPRKHRGFALSACWVPPDEAEDHRQNQAAVSRPVRISAVAGVVALVFGADSAAAVAIPWDKGGATPPSRTPGPEKPDPHCTESYADDEPRRGARIRFGIGPRPAGEGGTGQTGAIVPGMPSQRDRKLRRLKGPGFFAVRLNRLFMSEGRAGIRKFKRLARHFASRGLEVELQVRYHPAPEDEG